MTELLDRRFLFVVGKGGVGKTTVSAAIALAAARKGKRTLIAMCNAKERLGHLLEVGDIGHQIVRVTENLDAVNMDPQHALEEYGLMILRVKALYKAVFENRFVRAFLRGTPGIEAWSMLGKAYFHATDQIPMASYDLVVLDAPATGHGLEMLRVPQVIVDVAPPGLLRREAENALRLFRDPRRSGVVLVTLPEDMPANETIELHTALRKELRLPVARLVVNQKLPDLFTPEERTLLRTLPAALPEGSPLETLARASRARALRETVQRESLDLLASAISEPRTDLPFILTQDFRRASVDALSHAFG